MYKKITHYKDKKHFGNQIVVYKNINNYFIITQDRGVKYYSFVDNNLDFLYPMDTYMRNINFDFDFNDAKEEIIESFEIDLSRYGHSDCPEYLKKLIKNVKII